MKYDVKTIINGVEIMDKAEPGKTSITGVALMNSVSGGALEIGSVAIDKLTLTLINPYKTAFDGDTVELWIAPDEDGDGTDRIGELEELIGAETEEESIDDADIDVSVDEEEEEGEDMSEEELAESAAEEALLREKIVEQVDGESMENEEVTTDEAAEEAWKKVGTFFVYSQKSTSEGLQLVCFDSTIFLHGTYTPAKVTDTVQNHFNSFRTACQTETGVAVESFTFDGVYNKEITWDFSCSYRDALGYFAGLAGGFAHADENGEIGISFYLTDNTILLKEELMDYREESSGEIVIDGMSCNRSRTTNLTSDVIETGAGQSVSWTNPFVDENILEDIFSQYRGTRYIGAAVSCRWDLSLQAGDLIRIMSEAEYENWLRMRNAAESEEDDSSIRAEMATQGKIILIGTQTVKFAGEAITTIKSARAAETARENEMTSPWKKSAMELADETATAQSTADEARRLVVDTIAAQEAHFQKLTADEAKIQSLEADSAEVKNLVAEKASVADLTAATGRIDSLETGKASVEQLEAAEAKIETLTAEKADINALKAAQANIDDLKTSKADIDFANVVVGNVSEAWVRNLFIQGGFVSQSGTVYNLVGVRIDGDLINANTVKADKLLLQGDDGLYYAVNVNALGETTASSDAKYQKGIDGSVIVAHSITADQITANNIVGTGGWINLAEGRFKYGNTGTGNSISWDGKSLEISLDKLNITSSSGISISVGERLADTLADVTVEYADSTSPTTAPTSGWSTTAPEWQEGHYTWSRTTSTNIDGTTKTSDPVCITGNAGGHGPPGADGKDAILLQIDSANGTQFKNTGIATTLTVTIRYGDKTITKSSQMYEAFGSSAYLTWSEKKIGETEFTPLSQGDSRIGDNGFYLTIGADDVDEKSVFECELNF